MKRALAIAALVLGVAAGALAVVARREPEAASQPSVAAAPRAAAPVPMLARERFVVGTERTYDATARYDIDLVRDGRAQSVPIEVAGRWRVTIVRADGTGILMRAELAATATAAGARSPVLAAQLSRPHYIELAPTGTLAAAHFEPEQDDLARGILQSLAATVALPGIDGDAPHWEADELDATGAYTAAYERSGATVVKTKQRYRIPEVVELASTATYHLDADAWPETLASDERMTVERTRLTVRSHARIALARAATATVAVGRIDLGTLETERMGQPSRHHSRQADRDTLAGATFAELMADLAHATAQDSGPLGAKLEALVRLEPARAAELAQRVVAGIDKRSTSIIAGALGAANTAEAQHALAALLDAGFAQAAIASTMIEQPSRELTDALDARAASTDRALASSSSLALGLAAARLRNDGDPRGSAIVDELLAQLAADPARTPDILRALGNAGDPRALPALRTALASTDPRIRALAVEALRSIAEPTVDGLIAQVMLDDADASVRRAAVFASSARSLAPLLPALGRALADRDDDVRLEVVLALGQQRSPATTALLERVAGTDPADNVRTEARRQLGT